MKAIRRTIWFSGMVQGVGFRYTTRAVAAGFEVCGYVRNAPDGRVELIVEGNPGEVDRFQSAVADALSAHIESIEASDAAATGEYQDFTIRH